MKKYNLIILAGDDNEQWHKEYGCRTKACLPISGKPMLDWVIEAFHQSDYFQNIFVVGNKATGKLSAMKYVQKRLWPGFNIVQNILQAVLYIKCSIYRFAKNHQGYVLSFCDAPFLTPAVIRATMANISKTPADIVLHYVNKDTLLRAGLPAEERSYMTVDGKQYTGSNIYYIRKFSILLKFLFEITRLRRYRKNPDKILTLLGCTGKDLGQIEEILSSKLSAKVRILISPYPEMGLDVDKTSDYHLANRLLGQIPRPARPDDFIGTNFITPEFKHENTYSSLVC